MKHLLLARHGKPSWANREIADLDRPLKPSGLAETYRMAEWLQKQKVPVDLIITSPAVRAIQTALVFARAIKYPTYRMEINEHLYSDDQAKLVKFLHSMDNRYDNIMLIGHDPALTNLYNHLTKEAIDKVPSSGLAHLALKVETFAALKKGSCKSKFLKSPKKLTKKS